ncbi:MAG TPA: peptide chain release factor 1 [Candidatus Portnoybacteria bacterium]|nr:peptide chain release factor 1 [Candidatus Portnoybacteria bacterium]
MKNLEMINQLESIEKEYDQVSKKLSQPQIITDSKKFQELSQRESQLRKLVEKYREFKKVEQNLAENEEIIKKETDQALISLALSETKDLKEQKRNLEKELDRVLNQKSPLQAQKQKSAIVEIRAGAGGEEASLFAADLFRMYTHYGEKQGWQSHILSSNRTGLGGFKEVIFELTDSDVFEKIKNESGVHRVQRIPATEKSGRIHTSTVSVAVLPEPSKVEIEIKPEELRIDVFRASGPGGQHVNVTSSAVRITHLPTGLVVSSQEERSQHKNKAQAMKILRSRLFSSKQKEELAKRGEERKAQIGGAERAEKIRTYNFPQDRMTDHRIKKSWRGLSDILDGNIDQIIKTVKTKIPSQNQRATG